MMDNKKIVLCLMFITAVAMVSGSFFEVYMQGSGKEQLMDLLSLQFSTEKASDFSKIFISSLTSILKQWGFMFLCPIVPFLSLCSPLICVFKGLSVGFSSTMLIETFGLKGSLYILTTIMPHSIIQLPLFCVLSCYSLKMSIATSKYYFKKDNRKRNKNALQTAARHYITIYLISLVILIISCLIEAFLKRVLL